MHFSKEGYYYNSEIRSVNLQSIGGMGELLRELGDILPCVDIDLDNHNNLEITICPKSPFSCK